MTRPSRDPDPRRPVIVALLAAGLLAGTLPGPGLAGSGRAAGVPGAAAAGGAVIVAAQTPPEPSQARQSSISYAADVEPNTAGDAVLAAPPAQDVADQAVPGVAPSTGEPSTAYADWLAHEHDRIAFQPGGRVTVGFRPRSGDGWSVGGSSPVALPAGDASGAQMAATRQGSVWTGSSPVQRAPSSPAPAGPVDAPSSVVAGRAIAVAYQAPATPATAATPAAQAGLRRQVFGFLPYWELSGAPTSLDYRVLTTIAYFSVGADAKGNLQKRTSNGSLTTGWGGWTSSSLTSVINAAHAAGTRVVLTSSVFAWTSGGVALQQALLSSSAARLNLARQLAAAVRDRGADGVNLDFEPLVSGQEANFVALLKTLRAQLNSIRPGYQITYDTTGFPGNYPLEASVGPGAADAVFIMGYDYRTSSASSSGSVDPLSGPTYDLTDTVIQYTSRISPSRVILGVPWYGRAWSTKTSAPRSATQTGAKYGYSAAVNYENIPALVAKYGRKWDSVEQSPYIVYQRQNCTAAYGCVTSWRQVWYDDAASLGLRYGVVNDYGLRGAGMWALGYDGGHKEMYRALSDAFLVDHAAPRAGIKALPPTSGDEGVVVAWSAADVSGVRSYDVQVSTDGKPWTPWLTGTAQTTDVWLGADGHGYAFRVRATDGKGNTGGWNVSAIAAATPTSLGVGRFGRVVLDGLAFRAGPATSAVKLGSLAAGTIVALTSGPVSAGGYTWYEVTQPIREWAPVSFVERGVWIAVRSGTTANVVPFHAPNATVVDAGIKGFDFANGGAVGSGAGPVGDRTFSPNRDGVRDTLALRWTSTVALGSVTLNVLRLDGSSVGSVAVSAPGVGAHVWRWDGTVGGKRVPDGRYLLQLVGVAGATRYRAPSAMPATAAQIAGYAVTVDTVPPAITAASTTSTLISPNGDGIRDTTSYALTSPGAASWSVQITAGSSAPVRTARGSGGTLKFTWNGRSDAGGVVPDGQYTATLAACDVAGNCATRRFGVRVDDTPPKVSASAAVPAFSPNGDGSGDTVALAWTSSEPAAGTAAVWQGRTLVRRWSVGTATSGAVTWDGRNGTGSPAADGRYTFTVDVRDLAGNRAVASTGITVDRTAGHLRWSGSFFPQDGDKLAATSMLSWQMTRTAVTTLALFDASGRLVRTVWTNRKLAAGTRTWVWDGRLANGSFAPQGVYTARLTVVSPYGTQSLTRAVWAAAFPATLSASTVRAGQKLTVSFTSTEPIRGTPTVTLRQPGLPAIRIAATRLANGSYRATFTIRAGAAGAASVTISATDTVGHANATVYALQMAR